jgi:hypothetical protein
MLVVAQKDSFLHLIKGFPCQPKSFMGPSILAMSMSIKGLLQIFMWRAHRDPKRLGVANHIPIYFEFHTHYLFSL